MKKTFAVFVSLVMLINILTISVAFADSQYVEVKVNSAAIRNDCSDSSRVLQWVDSGTTLRVIESKNIFPQGQWYKVEYETGYSCAFGWISGGDVSMHNHDYKKYSYNGNTFGVCTKCRTVSMENVKTVEYKKADSLALAITTVGLSAADGPLPILDVVGLCILGLASLEMGNEASSYQIKEWAKSVSIDDYVLENNQCSVESFFRVERVSTGLRKIDNTCLNAFQAFLCSRFLNTDVWTMSPDAAYLCAAMNGRFYGPEKDNKNNENKYYHYHYGMNYNDRDANTHVFFSELLIMGISRINKEDVIMTHINVLTNLMKGLFNAEVISAEEANLWLEPGEELIVGYSFPDKKKGYYLMSQNDMSLLTKEQYEIYTVKHEYPFPDMKVIVFNDNNTTYYRITGGISSVINNVIETWENWNG